MSAGGGTGDVDASVFTTTFGEALFNATEPLLLDDDAQLFYATACDAIGCMYQGLEDIVVDQGDMPGWMILYSPDLCPVAWLPWTLSQIGIDTPIGASEAQMRALLVEVPPSERGNDDALERAVAATLTGTKQVRIVGQAGGDAYAIDVFTRTDETPDPTATEAAAEAALIAGLKLTYDLRDGPVIDEATRTIDAGTATIDTVTLADVT